jgi:hypothetical protein
VDYAGAYNASTAYHAGEFVVGSDGITYQCVKDGTVGVTPTPWAPAPTIPYGTSLPASPTDGQEAILVDSVTNPSYQWRFRYNAGSTSSYKWEFIGGVAASSEIAAGQAFSSSTYIDVATVGPQLTLPRAGDYICEFGCTVQQGQAAATAVYVALKRGAAATSDNDSAALDLAATSIVPNLATFMRALRANGAAATDVYKLQYRNSAGGAVTASNRWLTIVPVRVS